MTEVVTRFKDFTRSEEPVTFQIGPDLFTCVPEVPFDVLMDMAEIAGNMQGTSRTEMIAKTREFFSGVMEPESYELFDSRMKRGAKLPIGMKHFQEILAWMLEVYGLRPTRPSEPSADGSDDSEESSTGTASPTT